MDYQALANELLTIYAGLMHDQASRRVSQMIRGEHFVLNYLFMNSGQAQPKELSMAMDVSTARIAVLLNRLEEKGFVLRTADPEDNRRVIVTLLEPGRQEVERTRTEVRGCMAEMLERLGPEDAEAYLRIQKKLARNRKEKKAQGAD